MIKLLEPQFLRLGSGNSLRIVHICTSIDNHNWQERLQRSPEDGRKWAVLSAAAGLSFSLFSSIYNKLAHLYQKTENFILSSFQSRENKDLNSSFTTLFILNRCQDQSNLVQEKDPCRYLSPTSSSTHQDGNKTIRTSENRKTSPIGQRYEKHLKV